MNTAETTVDLQNHTDNRQDAVARGRWQALLLEAGGIGAAMSGESMRKLSYCLQWLQVKARALDNLQYRS